MPKWHQQFKILFCMFLIMHIYYILFNIHNYIVFFNFTYIGHRSTCKTAIDTHAGTFFMYLIPVCAIIFIMFIFYVSKQIKALKTQNKETDTKWNVRSLENKIKTWQVILCLKFKWTGCVIDYQCQWQFLLACGKDVNYYHLNNDL